jgi:hypothetical protein
MLKGDLHARIDLKHFVGGEEQSRLAHIDSFARLPVLCAFQPIAQRNTQFMTRGANWTCGSLALFQSGGIGLVHFVSVDILTKAAVGPLSGSFRASPGQ